MKLESVQHKILCWIMGTHPRTAKNDILVDCKIETLESRRDYFFLKRWQKSIKKCKKISNSLALDKGKPSQTNRFLKICQKYDINNISIINQNFTEIYQQIRNH